MSGESVVCKTFQTIKTNGHVCVCVHYMRMDGICPEPKGRLAQVSMLHLVNLLALENNDSSYIYIYIGLHNNNICTIVNPELKINCTFKFWSINRLFKLSLFDFLIIFLQVIKNSLRVYKEGNREAKNIRCPII